MDQKICADERWLVSSSAENASEFKEEDDDDVDDEEALSMSDLPLIHQWRKGKENGDDSSKNVDSPAREVGQEEFDFCSVSKESEMCAADEVFFQGQILPLRNSVSSEKGLLLQHYDGRRHRSHSISRSDSMDHYYSSRSSSISSGSSSSAATKYKPKLPPRNQFHSHPSPSPRLHYPSSRQGGANHRNSIKKSSIWNVLRLGLVSTPPEIAFHDLKARSSTNCKNFGSRNSTSSNSSSNISSGGASKIKKMRPRLLGGCKCAADAVDSVAPRVVIIKRSASEGDVNHEIREENGEESKPPKLTKKHLSHHRTFEWLKQLSVEAAAADDA